VPVKGEGPQANVISATPPTPAFESLAKKGPDGKVIALEGCADILAFERNSLIDAATKERIKPAILNWLADVDQLAIDNLDFLEQLDPGAGKPSTLEKIDIENKTLLSQMSQMLTQLMSAGPLTAHLETKGVLTREQSQLNQTITGDFLQQCMNELQTATPAPELGIKEEAVRAWRINGLTRFLYTLSCKDAVVSYRRMQTDAAANIDAVVNSLALTGEAASKVKNEVPNVKAARTKADQRKAVLKLMEGLTFEQRRQFLTKTREVAPVKDPYVNTWS